jgi:hypothetical protein
MQIENNMSRNYVNPIKVTVNKFYKFDFVLFSSDFAKASNIFQAQISILDVPNLKL